MKKLLFFALTLLMSGVMFSQKMITRSGEIKFDATYPGAVDPVVGTNTTVSGVFDKTTGDIVAQVMIKSFKFKIPLMEEHFNENYMESDKLPKATFKGKVLNYDGKTGTYDVEGDFTIHGVTKKATTKMTLSMAGTKLVIAGNFSVKLNDYNLEVPALAKKTLSDTAKVTVKLELEEKK